MGAVKPRSLTLRALGLLLGWVGFYALGLGLAAALLWVPWTQLQYAGNLDPSAYLAAIAGGWILWGLRPRSTTTAPSGTQLDRAAHPALRALIDEVASQTRQPPPDEVLLVIDANAFTYVRRHFWRPAQRVIGIGLPIVSWLDPEALKAVIAHEIGHHLGGDVWLGPWLWRTRRSIADTLDHLEGSNFWLDLPFALYARMFMRRSLEVSRAQELYADRVAAQAVGADAAARALAIIERRAQLWHVYFWNEVAPVLGAGYMPPLVQGFALFEANRPLAERCQAAPEQLVVGASASAYDTHPTLAQRLEALACPEPDTSNNQTSLGLLKDLAHVEDLAVRSVLAGPQGRLERIDWCDVASRVWLPNWRTRLRASPALLQLTPKRLSLAAAALDDWAARTRIGVSMLSPEADRRRTMHLFGTWLAVALADAGFKVTAPPGAVVRATRGDAVLEPFNAIRALVEGTVSSSDWQAQCEALRLS
jgi:Zn-dependent protease with chaperone function